MEEKEGALFLLDESFYSSQLSGWDVDDRGGEIYIRAHECCVLKNNGNGCHIEIRKKIPVQTDGTLTLETALKFMDKTDHFCFAVNGKNDMPALKLTTSDGCLCYLDQNQNVVPIITYETNVYYGIKAKIDIDRLVIQLIVNGKNLKEIDFANKIKSVEQLVISTPKDEISEIYISQIKLHKNYLVYEKFISCPAGTVPFDWNVERASESSVCVQYLQEPDSADGNILVVKDGRRTVVPTVITKKFNAAHERLCCEFKIYFPHPHNQKKAVTFSLGGGETTAIRLCFKGNGIYSADGAMLRQTRANVWQHIRIEADIHNQTAQIKVNGKKITSLPFENNTDLLYNLQITTVAGDWSLFWITDVYVFAIFPKPKDYPAEPQIPQKKNYYIGMQTCNMWREGFHSGWDRIESYPERKPYLGWYTEGLSEVSDWEIKWLAEHGIDYLMFCWFTSDAYRGGPVRLVGAVECAMHEAFFNAKYKDKIKFAISWVGNLDVSAKDFRDYIIPFWVDYYLTDPGYMIIDNMPVIAVFGLNELVNSFGGAKMLKSEFDYLREVCKSIGFDGAIIIAHEPHRNEKPLLLAKEIGLDAIYCYGWGHNCHKGNMQQMAMQTQHDVGVIDVIPSVSQGYNDLAWTGCMNGSYLEPSHFKEILYWAKNEFMSLYPKESPASKMLMLDNWNEFGEGHFLMPSELYGFEYLDAVREVFTENAPHTDERPNENQLKRLQTLYYKDRKVLKSEKPQPLIPQKVMKGWYFCNNEDAQKWGAFSQIENLQIENGILKGVSAGSEPCLCLKEELNLNAVNAPYIRLTMKLIDSDNMVFKFYFITEEDSICDADKCITFYVSENYMERCHASCHNVNSWRGTVKQLMLQPLSSTGSFEIEAIEILEYDVVPARVEIKGELYSFFIEPIWENNILLAPLSGISNKLDIYIRWNSESSTMLVSKNDVEMIFKFDSDIVIINGNKREINCKPKLIDRTAMLPIQIICETLGYDTKWSESDSLRVLEIHESMQ